MLYKALVHWILRGPQGFKMDLYVSVTQCTNGPGSICTLRVELKSQLIRHLFHLYPFSVTDGRKALNGVQCCCVLCLYVCIYVGLPFSGGCFCIVFHGLCSNVSFLFCSVKLAGS